MDIKLKNNKIEINNFKIKFMNNKKRIIINFVIIILILIIGIVMIGMYYKIDEVGKGEKYEYKDRINGYLCIYEF